MENKYQIYLDNTQSNKTIKAILDEQEYDYLHYEYTSLIQNSKINGLGFCVLSDIENKNEIYIPYPFLKECILTIKKIEK